MKSFAALCFLAFVSATPEPVITPLAQLHVRQDDALVGWLSTSGASAFSEQRTCDYPATLSSSGSLAQCCEKGKTCNFFTKCSAGTVFAESTSVFCDQGLCNTGLVLSTAGASGDLSFLGCWPTQYGTAPVTLVRDIGSAAIATPTPTSDSSTAQSTDSSASSEAISSSQTASSGSSSVSESPTTIGSAAKSSPTGAAANIGTESKAMTGILGLLAAFLL